MAYENPIPVAVALVPAERTLVFGSGPAALPLRCFELLLVRRAIEPQIGKAALPGGYLDKMESVEAAAARELSEEAGLSLSPASARLASSSATPQNRLLAFAEFPPLSEAEASALLARFVPNGEVSEILVGGLARARSAASEGPADWAFPLHVDAAAKTLDRLNLAAVDRLMAPPERKAAVRAELRALGLLSDASEA